MRISDWSSYLCSSDLEVPDGAPVVFSAHGVPKSVPADAEARGLDYLDAPCPHVSTVHRQAERLVAAGRHKIRRASRRERVCQYATISGVAVSFTKKFRTHLFLTISPLTKQYII